jgi:molybdopterin-synthase adenylyltransferase
MPAELRFTTSQFDQLRDWLLPDEDEHAAALICGTGPDGLLACRSVVPFGSEDFEPTSGRLHLHISPIALARVAKQAARAGCTLVLCHSHPFPGAVSPSVVDLETELDLCGRVLPGRLAGRPVGALILGPDGFDGRAWHRGDAQPLELVVGGRRLQPLPPTRGLRCGETYDRQLLVWGTQGQTLLGRSRVSVVGLGGTGSHVAVQLAHLGVGNMVLVDNDVIEPSNLSRIIGATTADVTEPKVDVIASVIAGVSPTTTVDALDESVLEMDVRRLATSDLIVCCTDNHGSRAVLTELAAQYLVPMIDLGIEVQSSSRGSRAGGGVRVVRPGDPCLHCMGVLDPALVREDFLSDDQRAREAEHGYLRGVSEPAPAVISLNGVVASLAVTEGLDVILGLFDRQTRRLLYRAEARSVSTASTVREESCFVCGESGVVGLGDGRQLPRRPREPRAGSA